ncbi:regulator of microtubule dynamics protein 1-like isoform X2 [Symsagittifera roscoffensis]
MNPNHAAAHKMMGIALTEANLGKREKLANSNRVYNHLKTACELNPDDPEAHYFYGSVCFVACVIPSTVKSIAGLFVSLPKSSFEEALLHFSSAENLKPNFMCRNQFAMAKTYEMLGQFKEAHYWMEKASRFEAHTVKDKKDRNDAIETLNKWKTNKNFKLFFL